MTKTRFRDSRPSDPSTQRSVDSAIRQAVDRSTCGFPLGPISKCPVNGDSFVGLVYLNWSGLLHQAILIYRDRCFRVAR